MAENDRPFKIALWGAPSVGKTSALAAYAGSVAANGAGEWIDSDPTTAETMRALLQTWSRFGHNQLTLATSQAFEYRLRHKKSGRMVIFRDIRGGSSTALDEEPDFTEFLSADAKMLFVAWPRGDNQDLLPLNTALVATAAPERSVLVLTKVEMHLRVEEVGLFLYDPIGRAEKYGFPQGLIRMMRAFRGPIVPVSVFGYRTDGLPAAYMDELGRMLPWGVSPLNVEMPFEHVLRGVQ
jgi:hypothetical protein